ncbi:polysaccharide biosynthesis/export family protein [Qipengyuania sp. RANM35]|uniref:polysaccharide biosynthesis/export family protein n=1 Tax=Qipengyuania sp. RANM35 TaxID=3068635 RepID=UPI0034DB1E38
MMQSRSEKDANGSWRGFKKAMALMAAPLAVMLLAGCAASSLPTIAVSDANAAMNQGYRVSGGDKIRVSVFDEPTLTGEYDVGLDGGLSLPLLGTIPAQGKSAEQLAQAIAAALSEGGYVNDPRVSVDVALHRPFFILGEVQAPGEYPYAGDLTVEQAIAKAGGYTPRAARSEVVLRRASWPEPRRIKLGNSPLLIGPGDTIRVEEAFF